MLLLLVLLFGGQIALDPLQVPGFRGVPFEEPDSRAPVALLNRCRTNDQLHVDLAEESRVLQSLVERGIALQ